MGFKDIADVIRKHTGEDSNLVDKPEKSKDTLVFELFSRQTISRSCNRVRYACRQGRRVTCSVPGDFQN